MPPRRSRRASAGTARAAARTSTSDSDDGASNRPLPSAHPEDDVAWPTEDIASFCAVTGADADTARHMLAAAAGDIDAAVSLFLDGGVPAAIPAAAAEPVASEEYVRAPIQAREDVLVSGSEDDYDAWGHAPSPFSTAVRRLGGSLATTPFGVPFLASQDDDIVAQPASRESRAQRLSDLFRVPSGLVFAGGLAAARREGVRRGAYVLLTVHEPADFACQQMVRDVWRAELVREFLASTGTLLVFLAAGSAEAQRYAAYYPFGGVLPHYALIDPRTGQRVLTGPPARASNAEPLDPEAVVAQVASHVAEHPLAGDDHESASGDIARETPSSGIAQEASSDDNTAQTADSSASAPVTPVYGEPPEEPPAGDSQALTLQIRMPDGRRVRRRFRKEHAYTEVFAFVASALGAGPAVFEVMYADGGEMRPLSATPKTLGDLGLHMATLTVVPL